MLRATLILAAALNFLFVQVRCVAACAAVADLSAAQDHPCCPSHSGHPHQNSPPGCAHQTMAASGHLPAVVHVACPPISELAPSISDMRAPALTVFLREDPSPPDRVPAILRI